MKNIEGTKIDRTNKYWGRLYDKIDKIYNNPPFTLPNKTLLYRCSINEDPLYFNKSNTNSNLIYFGLDFVISVWIALEIKDRNPNINKFYLHVYELTKDINYKYISKDSGTIPELAKTVSKTTPCIHPQLILHGDKTSDEYNELGIEISFPRDSDYKDSINSIATHTINVSKLEKNRNKYIFEWDPKNAVNK